jgi:hypothetical protein
MAARANYVFWLAEISKNSSEITWPIELKFGENDEGIDLYKVLWVFLFIGNSSLLDLIKEHYFCMFIYYHWVNTTVGGFVSSEVFP